MESFKLTSSRALPTLPRVIEWITVLGNGKSAVVGLDFYPFMPSESTPPEVKASMMVLSLPKARAAIANAVDCSSLSYTEAASSFHSVHDAPFPATPEQYSECQSGRKTLLIQTGYSLGFSMSPESVGDGPLPLVLYHAGKPPGLNDAGIQGMVDSEAKMAEDPEVQAIWDKTMEDSLEKRGNEL
ncbi:hypothetical protein HDV00_001380 [Rhizophlyctis rosea]|nr:hypothetical protein HDV00_001380 [Rhizophlyctis rosea]